MSCKILPKLSKWHIYCVIILRKLPRHCVSQAAELCLLQSGIASITKMLVQIKS